MVQLGFVIVSGLDAGLALVVVVLNPFVIRHAALAARLPVILVCNKKYVVISDTF